MSQPRLLLPAALLLTAGLVLLPGVIQGQAAAPSVAELVDGLGSEDWGARQQAHAELLARGREVVPALREALGSPDPEVSLRAGQILEALELQEAGARPGAAVPTDLEEVLLLAARAVDPDVVVDDLRDTLARWSEELRGRIGECQVPDRILRRVVDFHFARLELRCEPQRDPTGFLISELLAQREVDPLALALGLKVVARRAGVELALARCEAQVFLVDARREEHPRWVDLEGGGAIRIQDEMEAYLRARPRHLYEPEQLEPLPVEKAVERYLEALLRRCVWAQDQAAARAVQNLRERLFPEPASGALAPEPE